MSELISMNDYALANGIPYSTVSSCFKRARRNGVRMPDVKGTRKSASFNFINLFDRDQLHQFFVSNATRINRRNKHLAESNGDYYTFVHVCQMIGISYFEVKSKLERYDIKPANTKQGDGVLNARRTTLYTVKSIQDALDLVVEIEQSHYQNQRKELTKPVKYDADFDGLMTQIFGNKYQHNQADNFMDFLGCYK